MEISPITGIRAFPAKVPAADAKHWAVFEMENSSRTGDETYSPGSGKSKDEDEDQYEETADAAEPEEEAAPEGVPEPKLLALEDGRSRKVSFFV